MTHDVDTEHCLPPQQTLHWSWGKEIILPRLQHEVSWMVGQTTFFFLLFILFYFISWLYPCFNCIAW